MILRINLIEIKDVTTFIDIIWDGPSPYSGDKIFLPHFIDHSYLNIYYSNHALLTREIFQRKIEDREMQEIFQIDYVTLDGSPMWGICNGDLIAIWNIKKN